MTSVDDRPALDPVDGDAAPELLVEGLSVRFGGLVAVDNVTLRARAGAVTGLIGPNGAGKTTLFNACTGVVTPSAGTVRLGSRSLDRHSTAWRARHGLGRTFQRMELFDTMTVADNVMLGREIRLAGQHWRHSGDSPAAPEGKRRVSSRGGRQLCREQADDALARCGIAGLAATTVGDLSTGHRRLVELARVMAGGFRFLLLDEPSSGLDVGETEAFGSILSAIVERDGIGILLVEHDMALVRSVCASISVLDFGRLVYEGSAEEALSADVVRAVYLGSEVGA
jgi:ABC-type branched-subunit amino acid transport system ATPase component